MQAAPDQPGTCATQEGEHVVHGRRGRCNPWHPSTALRDVQDSKAFVVGLLSGQLCPAAWCSFRANNIQGHLRSNGLVPGRAIRVRLPPTRGAQRLVILRREARKDEGVGVPCRRAIAHRLTADCRAGPAQVIRRRALLVGDPAGTADARQRDRGQGRQHRGHPPGGRGRVQCAGALPVECARVLPVCRILISLIAAMRRSLLDITQAVSRAAAIAFINCEEAQMKRQMLLAEEAHGVWRTPGGMLFGCVHCRLVDDSAPPSPLALPSSDNFEYLMCLLAAPEPYQTGVQIV